MSEYYEIYKKRLNRYGNNYQSRMDAMREKEFSYFLEKATNKISFTFSGNTYYGSFEEYKQDDTQTLHYLLTYVGINMPAGTLITVDDIHWMVFYKELSQSGGYDRYIMLKMSHLATWCDKQGNTYTSYGYLYGKRSSTIKDALMSDKISPLFFENDNLHMLIMPRNQNIERDYYFTLGESPFEAHYVVTGTDIQSTLGVEYVSLDPIFEYPELETKIETKDTENTSFWITGGIK